MLITRPHIPKYLMALSLALLIVLQALWLQTEYRSSVDSFSRETNMVFRSTLHQLNDSIFLNSFINTADSMQPERQLQQTKFRNTGFTTENIRHISIIDGEKSDDAGALDLSFNANRQVVLTLRNPDNPEDTLLVSRRFSSSPQEFRWMLTADMKGFDKEVISHHYRMNLKPSFAKIPFNVLEKEFNFSYPRSNPALRDTLPFTTSFHPFARMLYAAEFQGANLHLLKNLLPQAGFALFTTLLILTSFLFIIRSMHVQEKLLVQKDDFIGNITHELKTPVASVGVALEAMRNFGVLQDEQKTRDYLEMAGHELKRLELMTDKILKTSVLDFSEEIRNNKIVVDMANVSDRVASSFALLAEKKEVILSNENLGNTKLRGNEEHLTQMLYNLVDNALKYASEGGIVKVQVSEIPDHVVLEVIDKGPGIAPEYRNRIFEKFFRIPTGNVHNVKGYGLGLHYVEGVVRHHKGKISLDSQPGKGCRFVVRLPKAF
jgi:two-component system, OmpR family, phosphate regulon sensor histidine kinase PhoR